VAQRFATNQCRMRVAIWFAGASDILAEYLPSRTQYGFFRLIRMSAGSFDMGWILQLLQVTPCWYNAQKFRKK
jgi:hypothetical protein